MISDDNEMPFYGTLIQRCRVNKLGRTYSDKASLSPCLWTIGGRLWLYDN